MRPVEMERPTIKVFVKSDHGRKETLRQLIFGIEEEGIPCEVSEEAFPNAVSLAYQASQQSRLNVGLAFFIWDAISPHTGRPAPCRR